MKEMGGIKVLCKHGMIMHKSTFKWWVSSDKYKVIIKRDEVANMPNALQSLREQVLAKFFFTIGTSSPCKRMSCGCLKDVDASEPREHAAAAAKAMETTKQKEQKI